MSGRTVAIRYAKALYGAASQKKLIGAITDDLLNIDEIMVREPSIRDYCLKRHANSVLEMKFINTAFIPYVSRITGEMLKIAVRNRRLAALPYLCEALKKIIEEESGVIEVIVESAREKEKNVQEIIEIKMEKRLEKKIKIKNIVVPELLGGIRILWNNRMIDLSAIGRLKVMRTLLKVVR